MFIVAQKAIIDQIKSLRAQLMKDTAYSAISRREAQKNSQFDYIFATKKKANAELQRLATIIEMVSGLMRIKTCANSTCTHSYHGYRDGSCRRRKSVANLE